MHVGRALFVPGAGSRSCIHAILQIMLGKADTRDGTVEIAPLHLLAANVLFAVPLCWPGQV